MRDLGILSGHPGLLSPWLGIFVLPYNDAIDVNVKRVLRHFVSHIFSK